MTIGEDSAFDESEAFPRNSTMAAEACFASVVSQDQKDRLAYVLSYCDKKFLSEDQRYQAAKIAAIREVSELVRYSGFSVNETLETHKVPAHVVLVAVLKWLSIVNSKLAILRKAN